MEYLRIPELIKGKNYKCLARNFSIGKWNGEAFEYMRFKFGDTFQDVEYHWDVGGTVKPIKMMTVSSEVEQ